MELTINAQPRTALGKLNKKLRRQGILPAVLYGKGKVSIPLELPLKDFEKIYQQTGENTLVNLVIGGKEEKKVLIHEVAKHFMKDEPIHVDFYEVDLTRKLHAKVPLHLEGLAPAVKELGGVLIRNLSELEVEALPADLPPFIAVSLESLKTFDDLIRVGDLAASEKVRILARPEEVIVSIQAPRTEEELAELEKPTAEEEKVAVEGLAAEEKAEAGEGEKEEKEKDKEPPESKAEVAGEAKA